MIDVDPSAERRGGWGDGTLFSSRTEESLWNEIPLLLLMSEQFWKSQSFGGKSIGLYREGNLHNAHVRTGGEHKHFQTNHAAVFAPWCEVCVCVCGKQREQEQQHKRQTVKEFTKQVQDGQRTSDFFFMLAGVVTPMFALKKQIRVLHSWSSWRSMARSFVQGSSSKLECDCSSTRRRTSDEDIEGCGREGLDRNCQCGRSPSKDGVKERTRDLRRWCHGNDKSWESVEIDDRSRTSQVDRESVIALETAEQRQNQYLADGDSGECWKIKKKCGSLGSERQGDSACSELFRVFFFLSCRRGWQKAWGSVYCVAASRCPAARASCGSFSSCVSPTQAALGKFEGGQDRAVHGSPRPRRHKRVEVSAGGLREGPSSDGSSAPIFHTGSPMMVEDSRPWPSCRSSKKSSSSWSRRPGGRSESICCGPQSWSWFWSAVFVLEFRRQRLSTIRSTFWVQRAWKVSSARQVLVLATLDILNWFRVENRHRLDCPHFWNLRSNEVPQQASTGHDPQWVGWGWAALLHYARKMAVLRSKLATFWSISWRERQPSRFRRWWKSPRRRTSSICPRSGCECVANIVQAIIDSDEFATILNVDGIRAFDIISRNAIDGWDAVFPCQTLFSGITSVWPTLSEVEWTPCGPMSSAGQGVGRGWWSTRRREMVSADGPVLESLAVSPGNTRILVRTGCVWSRVAPQRLLHCPS